MGHILTVKDKDGKSTSVEISDNLGVSKAVKTLQEKVEALQHKTMRSSLNAKLPHNIGEKVYSSIPLDVYGYIKFDGRKIYSYDEFGDFYYHIKDIYNLLNSERYTYQLEKNYDLIGDPIDNYGRVSNFTHNSKYARAKKVIKFSDYNAWRCEFYIKMGAEVLSNKIYTFIGRDSATYVNGLLFRVEKSKFTVWHKNLSGTYVGQEGKTVLAPNTEYLVRITYLNGKLILSTKVINVEGAIDQYFKEFEVDSQNYPDSFMRFGDDYNSDAIMNGEVDLNRMRFYDLSNEDLSDLDIFFDSAPCFYKPSEMLETWSKQGFVPESVYEKELEKFGCSGKYVLNDEENYVRIPLHKDRQLIVNQTYSDGSWLRVYDDGYCEQSGFTHPNGSDNVETLWFHQPMKDTNYQVFVNMQWPSNGGASWQYFCAKNLTTKTFQVMRQASYKSNYEIKGYVNLDEVPEDLKNVPQDNFEYLVVANGIDNISVDRNDALTVNDPYVLLESRYTDLKMNNISWLRYEGETLTKAQYPSAYKKMIEYRNAYDAYRNWENREELDDYSGKPDMPEVIVKLSTEEHTDDDYVLNQEDETFTLPKKNVQSFIESLAKNTIVLHSDDNLKIYSDGTCVYTVDITENGVVNYPYPLTSVVISADFGTITEKTSTSCTFTDIENTSHVTITGKVSSDVLETFMTYKDNEFYLYYYMGNTAQNLSLINVSKLAEELHDAKEEFRENANILEEVKGHTTKFSRTIAKTQVSKAVEDLVKQIKLRDVYTENMNENFLLPDPYFEGGKISFKGYNFAIFADSFKMFDEYSKRLYLLDIRYSEHYSELADENGDYNLSFDVYFTYDKRKELKTNVINPYSGDVTNLPDYDSKARLRIKVYGEKTINELNTPDGGENVYSGLSVNNIHSAPIDEIHVKHDRLSVIPEEITITNIRNRQYSLLAPFLRGEGVDSLPLGEMELNFAGLRVQKVSGNFRNAPYGYYISAYQCRWWVVWGPDNLWYHPDQSLNPSSGMVDGRNTNVMISYRDNNEIYGPMMGNTYSITADNLMHHGMRSICNLTGYSRSARLYDSQGGEIVNGSGQVNIWGHARSSSGRTSPLEVNNASVFAQRMSEFSMTVMNRYGSKTIIYDKTNVDQSKNNPCVFDFTQEMEIDDTKELVYRSDLDAYTSQQTEDYNTKITELTTAVNNKISEMDGKYNTFTSDANTTIVQYENEMDKRYENSIGAVDRRETEHNTTLTNNLNSEISRAKSAETTLQNILQNNIDALTTNTTNNLNAYKEYVQDGYSKVKVVDHLDKCTEDNIIYLVDPTWNNDYEVQTYEDREIKNLTHD